MKRIGIAASKIAKGNVLVYNLAVLVISVLFSAFIFIVAGSTVMIALVIIMAVGNVLIPSLGRNDWKIVFKICMLSLTAIIVLFNLLAVLINIKTGLHHDEHKSR